MTARERASNPSRLSCAASWKSVGNSQRYVVLFLFLVVGTASSGCGRESREAASGQGDERSAQQPTTLSIEWRFSPDSAEKSMILKTLGKLEEAAMHPAPGSVGVLHRFSASENDGRYLLVGFLPGPVDEQGHRPVAVFAIGNGVGVFGYSEPWAFARDALYAYGVTEVADLDGDGLSDVAYCT